MSQNNVHQLRPWQVIARTFGDEHVVFFLKLLAGGFPAALGEDNRFMALLERLDPQFKKLTALYRSHLTAAVENFGNIEKFAVQIAKVDECLASISQYVKALKGNLPRAVDCFLAGEEQIAEYAGALDKLGPLEMLVTWKLAQFEEHFDKPVALQIWLRLTMDAAERSAWKRTHREDIRAIRAAVPGKLPPPETVALVMPQTLPELAAMRDQRWYIGDGDGQPKWMIASNGDGPKDQTLTIREWVTSKPKALRDVLPPLAFAFYETACPRFKGSDFDKAVSALGGEGDKKTSRKKPVRD